jgi:hypothetical protein
MKIVFNGDDFEGFLAAEKKAGEMGYITGTMQRDDPVAVIKNGPNVEHPGKWGYLDDRFKRKMAGVIIGPIRNGPVALIIFDSSDKNPY